jgi:hypothetical protein
MWILDAKIMAWLKFQSSVFQKAVGKHSQHIHRTSADTTFCHATETTEKNPDCRSQKITTIMAKFQIVKLLKSWKKDSLKWRRTEFRKLTEVIPDFMAFIEN